MVGIAVPLVGIVVTLLVNRATPASSPAPQPSTDRADSAAPTSTEKRGTGSAPPPKVRFGPGDVRLEFLLTGHVDLDSAPPLATDSRTDGTDISLESHTWVDVHGQLAPLPSTGPDPSEAECTAQLQNNGTEWIKKLARGVRFCVQTYEGRTAYARVITAPTESAAGTVLLKVTVWELPGE
ncbi:hypothetical protein STSP_59750 [Streptomyces jeddahensis]|uniref:Uncharacterized protein n=1 Tax=Streptomyces jeddahensis TaxID=1716141 RepID=A0A177HJX9_9ACTN|nr:hypothetical protein STSP_59750 [Streptomyces jeddahensis]